MGTSTATGTGRRAGLDADEVIDAALGLVEAGGPEALTMRKLAADLGVTTTTIYWHVGHRDELILAMIRRRSAQQASRRVTGASPRDRITSIATTVWRDALEQPHVTALAHQAGATTLLGQPAREAFARELDTAGVRGRDARDAMQAIFLCVAGFLVAGLGEIDAKAPDRRLFDRTIRAVVDAFVPESREASA